MQCCCEGNNDNVSLSSDKAAEMLKKIDIVKKIVFQVEKVLLEANTGANIGFGNSCHDKDRTSRCGEVWQLLSSMNGILGGCLVRILVLLIFM